MTTSLTRLGAAAIALGLGTLVLWQAGVIFSSGDEGGAGLDLSAADSSIETHAPEGFSVGLEPGDVAPDFEFSSYEGERQRLSDYRGRPVLVNFWATWCGPCRTEMPAIDEAKRRYEEDNFAVIAMNRGESHARTSDWLSDLGLNFTAFGHDPEESVYREYARGVRGLPISYFIDAQGIITEVVLGPLRESDLEFAIPKTIEGFEAPQQ